MTATDQKDMDDKNDKIAAIRTLFTLFDRFPSLPANFDLVGSATAAINLYASVSPTVGNSPKSSVETLIRINKTLSWMISNVEREYITPETVKVGYFHTIRIIATIQGELLTQIEEAMK